MYKNNFVAVIKNGGKILRERSGIVYLPFGSEYSILLKNKDARRANVTIEVDGQDVLNGHSLIVDGNESQEIKGFMRNMSRTNKFRFIKKTKEIQEHRGDRIDDGLVRVTYQFERREDFEFPIRKIWIDDPIRSRGGGSGDWNIFHSATFGGTSNCSSSSNLYSSNSCSTVKCTAPLTDEGVTVKGKDISQQYTRGYLGQLETEINTIILQLRGQTATSKKVNKPVTVKTRLKCSTCGRRNKSTNRYCYNCGTYLL
jgi:hypothetical protein